MAITQYIQKTNLDLYKPAQKKLIQMTRHTHIFYMTYVFYKVSKVK